MKDDYGKAWTKQDYGLAAISVILIIIAISIPACILLLFNLLTGWKYYWVSFSVLFVSITAFNIYQTIKVNKLETKILMYIKGKTP